MQIRDDQMKGIEMDTSFSEEVVVEDFPEKFMNPAMEKYDGSANLEDHFITFERHM